MYIFLKSYLILLLYNHANMTSMSFMFNFFKFEFHFFRKYVIFTVYRAST